jgi:hypothetical protein
VENWAKIAAKKAANLALLLIYISQSAYAGEMTNG